MDISSSQAHKNYTTLGGIEITRRKQTLQPGKATDSILEKINDKQGALFSSRYEYPGRYSRWDVGFITPPIEIRANGRKFTILALNERGKTLLNPMYTQLKGLSELSALDYNDIGITGEVMNSTQVYEEEKRSQQPSIFTIIRAIKSLFESQEDSFLGLYGAFGYDLVFQFEPMTFKKERSKNDADLVLYLPDELVIVDHQSNQAHKYSYEFSYKNTCTDGLPREGKNTEETDVPHPVQKNYYPGKYANVVRKAQHAFKHGDMFEVVPSQTLYEPCKSDAVDVFRRLQAINPSPYGFIINLGTEYLVGSSPEMYVRVEGDRVETCPISGTIKRGTNPLEDADQIRSLLNSKKDEEELTMCTDVDRNDKSRICVPGSVNVLGRRQIEMYSHLIHTVDHVEGKLEQEFDALDAFLTHMWAVTVTGAPKKAAIKWIEDNEETPRGWYGGAVGWYNFNGNLNTGLTLRTIKLKEKAAEVRVGATLLYDSIPEDEEQETLTKAAGLIKAIREPVNQKGQFFEVPQLGTGQKVLIVDHEDSFVHTLANYFKQTGAEVVTLRAPIARDELVNRPNFDLVVLSPGPGKPEQFEVLKTIELSIQSQIPIFGVCLGFQGIVEYFGGSINVLDYPQHGKSAIVTKLVDTPLMDTLPDQFTVSRYHSLYADNVPENIEITGVSHDNVPMALQHKELPISAVQFHPESIVTSKDNIGMKIISNVVSQLQKNKKTLTV